MGARRGRRRASCLLVWFILCSSGIAATIPAASAQGGFDLTISEFTTPEDGIVYPTGSYEIEFTVTNLGGPWSNSNGRKATIYLCEFDVAQCNDSNDDEKWENNLPSSITTDAEVDIGTFPEYANMNTPGDYTITGILDSQGADPGANDALTIHVSVVEPFEDVTANQFSGEGVFTTEEVLNSNTPYPIEVEFLVSSSWANTHARVGWTLYDNETNELIDHKNFTTTDIPQAAGQGILNNDVVVTLPAFEVSKTGVFRIEAGLITDDEGDDNMNAPDPNAHNDLISKVIHVNDSIDLSITMIRPHSIKGSSGEILEKEEYLYRYGDDSLIVEVENSGNKTAENTVITVILYCAELWAEGGDVVCEEEEELIRNSKWVDLPPKQQTQIAFPVRSLVSLTAMIAILHADDISQGNNILNTEINVTIPEINPYITLVNASKIFEVNEEVVLIGGGNSFAPQPLRFEWRLDGGIVIGTDVRVTFTMPFGEHEITLIVTDALNRSRLAVEEGFIVENRTQFEIPNLEGIAITRTRSAVQASIQLPELGQRYLGIPAGLSPLRLIDIEVYSTQFGFEDVQLSRIEADLSLNTNVVSDTINRTTLTLMRVENSNRGPQLVDLNDQEEFRIISEDQASIVLTETSGNYVLLGEQTPPNVSAEPVTTSRGPNGRMYLAWTPSGAVDDDYFGGWQIRRAEFNHSTINNVTWSTTGELETFWTDNAVIVEERLIAAINQWDDPVRVPHTECVSYLILPIGRSGQPDWTHAANATAESGNVDRNDCGDDAPPMENVSDLSVQQSYIFTDNKKCPTPDSGEPVVRLHHGCYSIELTWVWPSEIVNHTFMLHITERASENIAYFPACQFNSPTSDRFVDCEASTIEGITFIDANQSIMNGTPGERATIVFDFLFKQEIRPEHTYVFTFTVVDDVDNHNMVTIDQNQISVTITDMFWIDSETGEERTPDYIPPPPDDPPLNSAYLGDLENTSSSMSFQLTSIALFIVILANMIVIPISLRYWRQQRAGIADYIEEMEGPEVFDDDLDVADIYGL